MSDQRPKRRSAWREANGNGWLGLALFVVCVTAGALLFGSGEPEVAETPTSAQTTQ